MKQQATLPAGLSIGFRRYKIVPSEVDAPYNGLCDYGNETIEIKTTLKQTEQAATLLHEYFHGAAYDMGAHTGKRSQDEERLCQLFSFCVMELIQKDENWEAIKWIRKKSKRS